MYALPESTAMRNHPSSHLRAGVNAEIDARVTVGGDARPHHLVVPTAGVSPG
jgi:hypothetical protein